MEQLVSSVVYEHVQLDQLISVGPSSFCGFVPCFVPKLHSYKESLILLESCFSVGSSPGTSCSSAAKITSFFLNA